VKQLNSNEKELLSIQPDVVLKYSNTGEPSSSAIQGFFLSSLRKYNFACYELVPIFAQSSSNGGTRTVSCSSPLFQLLAVRLVLYTADAGADFDPAVLTNPDCDSRGRKPPSPKTAPIFANPSFQALTTPYFYQSEYAHSPGLNLCFYEDIDLSRFSKLDVNFGSPTPNALAIPPRSSKCVKETEFGNLLNRNWHPRVVMARPQIYQCGIGEVGLAELVGMSESDRLGD
jgi:hypothetical protein